MYLAEEPDTCERVAVKVFHPEFVELGHLEESLQLARLTGTRSHPNLVKVLNAGVLKNGKSFLAMEYFQGRNLREMLTQAGALDFRHVVDITIQVCAGLRIVHEQGFTHLDIKPSNLFIIENDNRYHAKILDFGMAKMAGSTAINIQAASDGLMDTPVLGMPEYWSPEQACGEGLDGRSDLYSLGVVMYEALSGKTPFWSHSVSDIIAQHVRYEPARLEPPANTPVIPEALVRIVLRCLEKNPTERFQSAEELSAELSKISLDVSDKQPEKLQESQPTIAPSALQAVGRQASLRRAVGIALALFILCGSALSVGWLLTRPDAKITSGALPESFAAEVPPEKPAREGPAPQVDDDSQQVEINFSSEPQGAYVYLTTGGPPLGQTPAKVNLDRRNEPVQLLFRFPDGEQMRIEFIPDRPMQVHARSNPLDRKGARSND